jgi:hypothetical protein
VEAAGGYEKFVNAANARRTTIGRSEMFAAGVSHRPFGAAGIAAWREKMKWQETFGYGHRASGLDAMLVDASTYCMAGWTRKLGCGGAAVGAMALGFGAVGATGASIVVGGASTVLQGASTIGDCRQAVDGSCVVNAASTALGVASFGMGATAQWVKAAPIKDPLKVFSTATGVPGWLTGLPPVGDRVDPD